MTYSDFLHNIQTNFNVTLAAHGTLLFETEAQGLFDAYLANLPPEERQYHTCSCCRSFVNRYGGLVSIDEQGRTHSVMWGDVSPEGLGFHAQGVAAMQALVESASVKGPFLASGRLFGTPTAGGFDHMHVTGLESHVWPAAHKLSARQRMAEKREQFGILQRALAEYSLEHLRTAMHVLGSNALYRSDRFIGPAAFLEKLQKDYSSAEDRRAKRNILWRALAGAPDGFCHPSSSVIGTLLDDIKAGYPFVDIQRRFEARARPEVYQRATVAPTAGAIERAEKLFAEMGLAPALQRRYMRTDEVEYRWKPTALAVHTQGKEQAVGPVFGHIAPKGATTASVAGIDLPATTMTWVKFAETVLPQASALEVLVPSNGSRFAALVTAADPGAPNLLAWDNPHSWYYAAGIDGEFRRRVQDAGGQYEDVDIRATLIWNNRNDLDLMMLTPLGNRIYFRDKRDFTGGELDVDRNVCGETMEPVENIRWPRGKAREGCYVVMLWNYAHHMPSRQDTPYQLELEVGGQRFTYEGVFRAGDPVRVQREVVRFSVDRNGKLLASPASPLNARTVSGTAATWGLTSGAFAKVVGISNSPNCWSKNPQAHFGEHTFFVLEGCRDEQTGRGRGFITETLRGDLREVRQVLEAHLKTAEIATVDNPACGIGMLKGNEWGITLRAMTPTGPRLIVIDRHD